MSQEKYKPTVEEIKKAEDAMTSEQVVMSVERSNLPYVYASQKVFEWVRRTGFS